MHPAVSTAWVGGVQCALAGNGVCPPPPLSSPLNTTCRPTAPPVIKHERLVHAVSRSKRLSPLPPRAAAESEIRSSMAFQVSRITSLMLKATRQAAGLDAWDGLVTGERPGASVLGSAAFDVTLSRWPAHATLPPAHTRD